MSPLLLPAAELKKPPVTIMHRKVQLPSPMIAKKEVSEVRKVP
jgi:hypothetical protein